MAEATDELAFTVRANHPAGIDPGAFTVTADGRDVTARCRVRTPRLVPLNRADFSYLPADGWPPGIHRVEVSGPGGQPEAVWSFETD